MIVYGFFSGESSAEDKRGGASSPSPIPEVTISALRILLFSFRLFLLTEVGLRLEKVSQQPLRIFKIQPAQRPRCEKNHDVGSGCVVT